MDNNTIDQRTYNQKIMFIHAEKLKIHNNEPSKYTLEGLKAYERRVKSCKVIVDNKK